MTDKNKLHLIRKSCFERQEHIISLIRDACYRKDVSAILTHSDSLMSEDLREKLIRNLIFEV